MKRVLESSEVPSQRLCEQAIDLLGLPTPALELLARMAPLEINLLCKHLHRAARPEIDRLLLNQILELNLSQYRENKLFGLILFLERRGTLTISDIRETLCPLLKRLNGIVGVQWICYLEGSAVAYDISMDHTSSLWDAYCNPKSVTISNDRDTWLRVIKCNLDSGMPGDIIAEILSRATVRPEVSGSLVCVDAQFVAALVEYKTPIPVINVALRALEIDDDVLNYSRIEVSDGLPPYQYMKEIFATTRLSIRKFVAIRLFYQRERLDDNSRRFVETPITVRTVDSNAAALEFIVVMRHLKDGLRDAHPWVQNVAMHTVLHWISGFELVENGPWLLRTLVIEPASVHIASFLSKIPYSSDPSPIIDELRRLGLLDAWLAKTLDTSLLEGGAYIDPFNRIALATLDRWGALPEEWIEKAGLRSNLMYTEHTTAHRELSSMFKRVLTRERPPDG